MVYVHVPFCRSFCTYCAFYSELVARDAASSRLAAWCEAVCAEAIRRRDEIAATAAVPTLYIGGGTPSVLSPSMLGAIVSCVQPPFEEFTIEVNPDDIVRQGPSWLKAVKELGVNRISMGVQSFDDGLLRKLARRHDSAAALQAFRLLRDAGFDNISLDLIFGVSGLSPEIWEESLSLLLDLHPEHVSAYQLSLDEGSELHAMAQKGLYRELPEEECRMQYDRLCSVLGGAGYHHYEVSNFAVPGREAIHNSAYWKRVPYVGLGPGAHSFDGSRRTWNEGCLTGWGSCSELLGPEEERLESLMLALRTDSGMPREELRSLCGGGVVDAMLSEGLLELSGGHVRIPESSFFIHDSLVARLA